MRIFAEPPGLRIERFRHLAHLANTGKQRRCELGTCIAEAFTGTFRSKRERMCRKKLGDRRCRVLVIDDDHECAACLAEILELAGHETYFICNGLEAAEAVERFTPSVVLLDISMPDVNGVEVARALRHRYRDVLLISISGFSETDIGFSRCFDIFDHHLVKPINFQKLDSLMPT